MKKTLMSGFKLIAIRPLPKCHKDFLKVLVPSTIYKLYNNYHFLNNQGGSVQIDEDISEVFCDNNIPSLSYNNSPSINISAIVGKNGSGKSSLTELIFLSVYAIAIHKNYLPDARNLKERLTILKNKERDENSSLEILSTEEITERKNERENEIKSINSNINEINFILENLKIELYYSINNNIYCLRVDKDNKALKLLKGQKYKERKYKIIELFDDSNNSIFIQDFFYSVALNYSAYGLNSRDIGKWIEALFHKNDGYKTPLVINPMRTEGNFDINNETHLCQTRTITNLIDDSMSVKSLVENKTVESLVLRIEEDKLHEIFSININNVLNKFKKNQSYDNRILFSNTLKTVLNIDSNTIPDDNFDSIKHIKYIRLYVFKKLFKIARNYDEYNKYFNIPKDGKPIPQLLELDKYLLALSKDFSHKTLKLRQILNAVYFNLLGDNIKKGIKWQGLQVEIPIKELISRVKNANKRYVGNIMELIPAAFFNLQIKVLGESGFQFLSSGEQQQVHVMQTIYYHLINLNSIHNSVNSGNTLQRYKNINLILDEIELYFHPDLQRKFIQEFINGLSRLQLPYIENINIIFSTHSPFILSDIPSSNILRLDTGIPQSYEDYAQTFGSNIHQLLADDFFMSNGFMGEISKKEINATFKQLQSEQISDDENLKDKIENIISLVGEPIIKQQLELLYENKYGQDKYLNWVDSELKRLNVLRKNRSQSND